MKNPTCVAGAASVTWTSQPIVAIRNKARISSRGDKTPLEFFLAGVRAWDRHAILLMGDARLTENDLQYDGYFVPSDSNAIVPANWNFASPFYVARTTLLRSLGASLTLAAIRLDVATTLPLEGWSDGSMRCGVPKKFRA
jgi:hypothetical protein